MPITIESEKYSASEWLFYATEGWQAALDGLSLNDNPYAPVDFRHEAWRVGWNMYPHKPNSI